MELSKRRFKVTAEYYDPWKEEPFRRKSAVVEADTPERAAVEAVLHRKVPIEFIRGDYGREAIFWWPEMHPQRWPDLISVEEPDEGTTRVTLGWGDDNNPGVLALEVHVQDGDAGGGGRMTGAT